MFSIGLTSCPDFDLLYINPEEIKNATLRKFFTTLSCTSPAMAFQLNEQGLVTLFKPVNDESMDGVYFEIVNRPRKDKMMIYIDARLANELTQEELRAVFEHEVGHVRNGDIAIKASGAPHDETAMEIAADAYAASMTSKQAMRSALQKVMAWMILNVPMCKGESIENLSAGICSNAQIEARFAALA